MTAHAINESMPEDDSLIRNALRLGRMNAYEWDVATDRVLHIPEGDLPTTGQSYLQIVHPDDRQPLLDVFAALTPEQPELVHEYRRVTGESTVWIQDTARAEFDDSGRVARLRGVAVDITERRQAEARLNLIAAVSEWISATDDPAELLYEASRIVGEYLHARRALFTEIDLDGDRGIVRRDYCRGVPSVAGVYRVSDYAEPTRREMISGRVVVNDDAKIDPRTAADYVKTYEPNGERSYVAIPLLRDGRWVAELWVSDDRPRHWQAQDLSVLVSIAERVWTAVEKLRVNAALRESEARMQFIGEQATVGYWYWDLANDSIHWSQVCSRLHGIPLGEQLTRERRLASLHAEDRAAVERVVSAVLDGSTPGEYEVEYRTVWADGSVHWVQSKGSATYENGKAVRMAGIALDVTRRKTLELEREEILAVERRLRVEADEASRAKDHFLALLSHELRTPMTTIVGWASFIRSGMADAATAKKGIESIEQASYTQSRLIDDLLDVSRIVTGKMALERKLLDVTEPVRNAMQVIEPAARAASITITAALGAAPSFVVGDAMRLQQVIWNLLANAVKFTPAGGRVDVEIVQTDDDVEIHVRDNGVGIEADFLPHVFARFRQAEDGPTRRFGGLGLGLSIARHLTESHGGSVHVTSAGRDRGAEFVVRLPRAPAVPDLAPHVEPERRIEACALAGIRVLLVDDDPAAREILGTMLSGFGARVTPAGSAAEAWQRFAAAAPDVLVSDIGMPEEDGYAFIRRLRESSSVPAVAVTAYADAGDRDRVLTAGFQAHLAKPVEPYALAAAVLRVLPERSAGVPAG